MATRRATVSFSVDPAKVLAELEAFDSTEENPTTTREVAGEFDGLTDTEAFNILTHLEDEGKITGEGRGLTAKWWLVKGDAISATPEPAKRTRRTKAQIAADNEETRKRTEYAARAAESQDEVMSQTPENQASVIPAVEPVTAENGENVTIPVDFDDPSKGRRELDASKGERLLSEDTYTVRVEPQPETWTPTYSDPKNEPYEGPESIPAVPEGVNENTWFMAHYADTETARAWWMRKAADQSIASATAEHVAGKDVAPF